METPSKQLDRPPAPALEYAAPAAPAWRALLDAISIVGSSAAFALGHWVTEYLTGRVMIFHFRVLGKPPPGQLEQRLRDEFADQLLIEGMIAVAAAVLVMIGQFLGRYATPLRLLERPRRGAWLIAAGFGAVFCWTRWGLWALLRPVDRPWSGLAQIAAGIVVAVLCAVQICRWRWPDREPL